MKSPVRYHLGKFPPKKLDWERLVPLIGGAREALGRYDGLLQAIPNADVMLAPLTTQEAVLSSRIEGTQATMGEVLGFEAGVIDEDLDDRKRGDIHEVLNYRKAMRQAVELLDTLPLCQRMLKQLHASLMDGVRGHDKHRGKYRPIQNWIGAPECMLEEAKFVPIAPGDPLVKGMAQWEKYVHANEPDPLVQLAIVHAEFESLHPFLDGNGRLGRMIVPLFLFERKLLHSPTFYISEYLEQNRDTYYWQLREVSASDNWTGWCAFFLRALGEQAERNQSKVRQILELYNSGKIRVVEATRSQYAIQALDFVFCQPIFSFSSFVRGSAIPEASSKRLLRRLVEEGFLQMVRERAGRKAALYAFAPLLTITEKGDPFMDHA